METILSLLEPLKEAALQLLRTPYLYVSLLLIALIYRRQIQLQRKLFYVRIHSFLREWWSTFIWGLFAGVIATVIFFLADVSIQPEIVPVLWVVALALMLFKLRFVCFAYVIGLLVFLQPVLQRIPQLPENEWLRSVVDTVIAIDTYSLLLIVGVLHLVEAVLVRVQGARMATPMFVMSKRGKVIGGYHFQRFWPVPLLLMAPFADGHGIWSMWSDPQQWIALLLLLPFPIVVGFSDMTLTQLPQDKAKSISNGLFLYAFAVIALAVLVRFIPETTILAGAMAILLHEALRWYGNRKEDKLLPLYTNSSLGLKILAVLPNSPADKLGIMVGETIYKVNGVQVKSRQQMYEAMLRNSAYCKLEIFNLDGNLKFLNRAVFSGEHHQLGIILAPDDDVQHYAEYREYSIFAYLKLKLGGIFKKSGRFG